MRFWQATIGFIGMLSCISAAGMANAQTCPHDLSSISGAIQTPALRPLLATDLDAVVAHEGLEASLSHAEARLSDLHQRSDQLPANAPPEVRAGLSDATLIAQTTLDALRCRRPGGG